MVLLLWLLAQAPVAVAEPPVPFYDNGACPFECCQYREWIAETAVQAFRYFDDSRPTKVFLVRTGERVLAMSGIVITKRAGVVRAPNPVRLAVYSTRFPRAAPETLNLAAGETLFVLRYGGEGHFVGWHKGRVLESVDGSEPGARLTTVSRPVTEWWARVRNSRGHIGWVRAERIWANQDACGL